MSKIKILLVDDDAFLRDMYATKFIESGHEVEAATNSAEAIQRIKENDYDVVLLDMIMPGMSGLELLEEIKKLELGKEDTKYIVLSNQGETTYQSAANEAGVAGYIIKAEVIPSEVVKRVEQLCQKNYIFLP